MINLAENGAVCECGSRRLAPIGDLAPGSLAICGACARAFRVALALLPVPWSTVELELEQTPYELQAFRWTRQGVPLEHRRTLPELEASGRRRRLAERNALAVGLAILVFVVLVIAKAVHS